MKKHIEKIDIKHYSESTFIIDIVEKINEHTEVLNYLLDRENERNEKCGVKFILGRSDISNPEYAYCQNPKGNCPVHNKKEPNWQELKEKLVEKFGVKGNFNKFWDSVIEVIKENI